MIREFLPYNSNSLGRIKDIGYVFGNYFYSYSICPWANGEYGSIIDFFSATDDVDDNGNSKLYSDKYTPFLQFVKGDIDLVGNEDCFSVCSDLRKNSPTVAIGFIAFFLLTEFSKRDYPAMYNEYYEIEKKVYTNRRRRTDPYCYDVNFDEEFSNGKHLLSEKENIKFSIKNLFPYLQEKDREFIKKVSDAYLKFVKSKATISIDSQTNENDGKKRKPSKKSKKNYSNYSFLLNIDSRKLEVLYLMLSQRDDTGKSFIDDDLQKYNDTKCLQLDNEYIKQLKTVDINKMLFKQVFLGKETDVQIVWRGDAVELWYLIYSLSNYKVTGKVLLEKSGPGPGLWQIVRSRFLNGKSRKVLDERTGKEVETDEPIEYEEKAFSKYSKKNSLSNPSVLDVIISKIAPPRDIGIKEEIKNEFSSMSEYEKNGSQTRITSQSGFHDTNHKRKDQ